MEDVVTLLVQGATCSDDDYFQALAQLFDAILTMQWRGPTTTTTTTTSVGLSPSDTVVRLLLALARQYGRDGAIFSEKFPSHPGRMAGLAYRCLDCLSMAQPMAADTAQEHAVLTDLFPRDEFVTPRM